MAHLLAFVDERGIQNDFPRNMPGDTNFAPFFSDFIQKVDHLKTTMRLRAATARKTDISILTLSVDYKAQIGGHLTAIINIVNEVSLKPARKEALHKRIARLQEEVNRDRTRTEAWTALWLDVTSAVGQGAENLEPVFARLEQIGRIFASANDEAQIRALEPPTQPKQLPAPQSTNGAGSGEENSRAGEVVGT